MAPLIQVNNKTEVNMNKPAASGKIGKKEGALLAYGGIFLGFGLEMSIIAIKNKVNIAKEKRQHENHLKEVEAKTNAEIQIIHARTDDKIRLMNAKAELNIKYAEGKKRQEEEATVNDPEKQLEAKKNEIRIKIIKSLGLYDVAPPTPERLVKEGEVSDIKRTPDFIVEPLLAKGDIFILCSPPGQGKSILAMQLAIEVAGGKLQLFPACVKHQSPQIVYVYDSEQEKSEILQRYGRCTYPDNLKWLKSSHFPSVYFFLNDVLDRISAEQGDMTIVLDNVSAAIPKPSDLEIYNLYLGISKIRHKFADQGRTITFIIVTHTIKDFTGELQMSDVAGAAGVTRFSTVVSGLAPHSSIPDASLLSIIKNRNGKKATYNVKIVDDPYAHFELISDNSDNKEAAEDEIASSNEGKIKKASRKLSDEDIENLKRDYQKGVNKTDLSKKYNISRPTVDAYLGKTKNEE